MLVTKWSIFIVVWITEILYICIVHFTKILSDPLSHLIFKNLYKVNPCNNKKKKEEMGSLIKELYFE